jgi:hypothetical protein
MIDLIRLRNVTSEMIHCAETGHVAKALQCHDEVRSLLLPKIYEPVVRPEDDPRRTPADREAWRVAR